MIDIYNEAFEKIPDLLNNPENNELLIYELLNSFKEHGGKILGCGRHATVLYHPSWKYVLKIFNDDVPYLKYVRFVLKNPRVSFPKFYDVPRRIIPNYKRHRTDSYLYVVKTEFLFPLNKDEQSDLFFVINNPREDTISDEDVEKSLYLKEIKERWGRNKKQI